MEHVYDCCDVWIHDGILPSSNMSHNELSCPTYAATVSAPVYRLLVMADHFCSPAEIAHKYSSCSAACLKSQQIGM